MGRQANRRGGPSRLGATEWKRRYLDFMLALGDSTAPGQSIIRFKMPFRTAASTSARSLSPPTMLFRELELSVPELPALSGVDPSAALVASMEFRSKRGKPVPPPLLGFGSGLTLTRSLSASTVTMDTAAWLASGISAVGTPMVDFGRNKPARERPPFFIPRPIFRIMIDADEAVEEIERLSVEPENRREPA